jgi:hypothetical protein
MAETAVSLYFQDKYFNDRNGQNQEINKRYEFAFNMEFKEANLALLMSFLPEKEHYDFIHQSKNEMLKRYIDLVPKLK